MRSYSRKFPGTWDNSSPVVKLINVFPFPDVHQNGRLQKSNSTAKVSDLPNMAARATVEQSQSCIWAAVCEHPLCSRIHCKQAPCCQVAHQASWLPNPPAPPPLGGPLAGECGASRLGHVSTCRTLTFMLTAMPNSISPHADHPLCVCQQAIISVDTVTNTIPGPH